MSQPRVTGKLFRAAKSGDTNDARTALDSGVQLNARDDAQRTPLHWAAARGSTDVGRLLIEHGADVNVRDFAMLTPLHLASLSGDTELARLLVERGADLTARDKWNDTPLDSAANHKEMVEMLEAAVKANSNHAGRVGARRDGSLDRETGR